MVELERIREIAAQFPGSEEGPCYGTPGFRVRKKLYARMLENGTSLVLKIDFDTREVLTKARPDRFEVTPHYEKYPMMIVDLRRVGVRELTELLEGAWRFCAPRTLIAKYDG